MSRCAALLFALAVVAGCGSPTTGGTDGGPDVDASGLDAGMRDAAGGDAASPDDDAGRTGDAGVADASTVRGDRLVLRDGTTLVGEIIATYDHAIFWHEPRAELTYALFRGERFAPYPDDRSVTFVSSFDVVERTPVALSSPPFVDAMRSRRFVIERPPLDGVSYVITGGESYHLEEDGYGQFALDIVRTGADGLAYVGTGTSNDDYLAFDEPVYLPTGGVVVEVVRDAPDNPPGVFDLDAVNNLVGIHLGGGYYLYLLHFRQNSIAPDVVVGAALPAGHYLGAVGNSGVSTAPHLHLAFLALDPASAPLRTWSVPVELADVYVSLSMRTRATRHDYVVVAGGTWISAAAF